MHLQSFIFYWYLNFYLWPCSHFLIFPDNRGNIKCLLLVCWCTYRPFWIKQNSACGLYSASLIINKYILFFCLISVFCFFDTFDICFWCRKLKVNYYNASEYNWWSGIAQAHNTAPGSLIGWVGSPFSSSSMPSVFYNDLNACRISIFFKIFHTFTYVFLYTVVQKKRANFGGL